MSKVHLLPFLLLDEAYSLYQKYISNYPVKRELKKYKSEWAKAYNDLNKSLFRNNDEDRIIDLMDSLADEVHNSLVMFRMRIFDMLPDHPLRDTIAAIYTYLTIVGLAIESHKLIYKNSSRELEKIRFWAEKFMALMFRSTGWDMIIDPNQNTACQNLVSKLWSSLANWISQNKQPLS